MLSAFPLFLFALSSFTFPALVFGLLIGVRAAFPARLTPFLALTPALRPLLLAGWVSAALRVVLARSVLTFAATLAPTFARILALFFRSLLLLFPGSFAWHMFYFSCSVLFFPC